MDLKQRKPLKKVRRYSRSNSTKKIEWQRAADIEASLKRLIKSSGANWVEIESIQAFRSWNAKTRAYARIWGLSRLWQIALDHPPGYVIEVISEKFDHLTPREKDQVLLHEIAHIPKNFSGALLPHSHGRGRFHDKLKTMFSNHEANEKRR